MSKELWKLGCRKTAKFIKDYSNSMVVFARFAVTGRRVPWNSNIIERLMGEISNIELFFNVAKKTVCG